MPGMLPASSGDAVSLPRSKWPALLVVMRHATTALNLRRLYQDDEVFVNETRDADALLTEAGVACLPGTSFGEQGKRYLRLSYANSAENLREALRRIGEYAASR